MSAILFGSISTVADTSELQRAAFNQAFVDHGLGWTWDRDDYIATLDKSGGAARIAAYAESRGQDVDATAVHQTKSKIFQETLGSSDVQPRPGVVATIRDAKSKGLKLGLVTTTSADNIAALLAALGPEIERADFDVVVDSSEVEQPKPDKAAYAFALAQLSETATDCVAIEDNVDGARSADAAGVAYVAFPNENTTQQDFTVAKSRVDALSLDALQDVISHS